MTRWKRCLMVCVSLMVSSTLVYRLQHIRYSYEAIKAIRHVDHSRVGTEHRQLFRGADTEGKGHHLDGDVFGDGQAVQQEVEGDTDYKNDNFSKSVIQSKFNDDKLVYVDEDIAKRSRIRIRNDHVKKNDYNNIDDNMVHRERMFDQKFKDINYYSRKLGVPRERVETVKGFKKEKGHSINSYLKVKENDIPMSHDKSKRVPINALREYLLLARKPGRLKQKPKQLNNLTKVKTMVGGKNITLKLVKRFANMNGKLIEVMSYVPDDDAGEDRTITILHTSKICSIAKPVLVVCVPVARENYLHRWAIRKTWGAYTYDMKTQSLLMFFIGNSKGEENPTVEAKLQDEMATYNDIVQGNFTDEYNSLTLKSLLIIQWTVKHCTDAKYLMKADDDTYVNLPHLLYVLKNTTRFLHSPNDTFILGFRHDDSRPVRQKNDKWFVPAKEFSHTIYPPYVNGGSGYAMPMATVRAIDKVAPFVPLIRMEDVYITGMCAKKAKIMIMNDVRFGQDVIEPGEFGGFIRLVSNSPHTPQNLFKIHDIVSKLSPVVYGYETIYKCQWTKCVN